MDYRQSSRVYGGGFTSGAYGEVERGFESNRYFDLLHFFREGIRGELCLVCPEYSFGTRGVGGKSVRGFIHGAGKGGFGIARIPGKDSLGIAGLVG